MDKRTKKDAVPNVAHAMMLIASMSAASTRGAKRPRDDAEDLDTKHNTEVDHVAPTLQPEPDSAEASASKQTTRRPAHRGAGVKRTTGRGKAGIDKTPHDGNNSADAACKYIASVAPRLSSDEHTPKLSAEMLTCEHTADIKSPYAEPKGYVKICPSLSCACCLFFSLSLSCLPTRDTFSRARALPPPHPSPLGDHTILSSFSCLCVYVCARALSLSLFLFLFLPLSPSLSLSLSLSHRTFGGGMIFVGTYPATIMFGVLMTTMTIGMALNSCSTFKRMFLQMGIPLDFNLLVVDGTTQGGCQGFRLCAELSRLCSRSRSHSCPRSHSLSPTVSLSRSYFLSGAAIPFMHPTHSGHFTWRPDVAATAIVAMWFRERILRAIKRVACGGRIPVLYVVAQVYALYTCLC
jgi:hypothetical protein